MISSVSPQKKGAAIDRDGFQISPTLLKHVSFDSIERAKRKLAEEGSLYDHMQ